MHPQASVEGATGNENAIFEFFERKKGGFGVNWGVFWEVLNIFLFMSIKSVKLGCLFDFMGFLG